MLPASGLVLQFHPFCIADSRASLSPELPHLFPVGQFGIHHQRTDGLDELTVAEDVGQRFGWQSLQPFQRSPGSIKQRGELSAPSPS
jgi:hypothetical protein